jgi:hypothetical protein
MGGQDTPLPCSPSTGAYSVWTTLVLAPLLLGSPPLAGYPSLRVKGHYSIVTLAYSMG